jgi:uncharacterized protein YjbI with pentapeptide repeats
MVGIRRRTIPSKFSEWFCNNLMLRYPAASTRMNCSYVHTDKTNGTKTPCGHAVYGREKLCVFHFPDVQTKAKDFTKALNALLDQAVASHAPLDLNFKGFVFPKVDFRNVVFRGIADFRAAIFMQDADFRSATFLQQTDFHTAEFKGHAGFFSVIFASNVRFLGTHFRGNAIFNGSKFRGSTAFHGCKFGDFAAWQGSKFDTPVIFQSNEFIRDADFRRATFFDGADFCQTMFRRRVDFEGTRFHGEVRFAETHIAFLKKLNCPRANMDGVVLHTAQIWENERLIRYSFRNSFLLSMNLAAKEFEDCDFTGAVFKAVLTVGWKPDRRTRLNTKYIYTDYRSEEIAMADGTKRRAYSPVLSSRVPAEGNFGEGEHANFTFADYLHDPIHLNIALNVPPLLRSAITNYLQLFTDFLKVTQGIPVELRTRLEGTKLRVEFLTETEENLAAIRESFAEYQRNTGRNFEELKLNIGFRKEVTPIERELFLMKMESQINLLKTELTYTQALYSKSEENRQLMARLVEVTRSPGVLLEPLLFAAPIPDVYVSYAWGEDATEEGRRREEIVDRLCDAVRSSGREIGRDKERMSAGDSIERFAQEISKAPRIIAVVSEKSLNSHYCMAHELFRAYRRCDYQRAEFQKKVIALVMDDAKVILKDDLAIISLAKAWKDKCEKLRSELAAVDPHRKSPTQWVFVDLIEEMCPRLPDMLGAIKDIVMKRGFDQIVADNFKEVLVRLP